jgi:hypothetical protein
MYKTCEAGAGATIKCHCCEANELACDSVQTALTDLERLLSSKLFAPPELHVLPQRRAAKNVL